MTEIERAFLCTVADPDALARAGRSQRIRQGYLNAGDPAVRIRQRDDGFILTVKSGAGLVRREVEFTVDPDKGRALMEMAGPRTVEKTRYTIGRWEVDCFHGCFQGLAMAEAELDHEDEPLPPVPHGVTLLREVTDDVRFTNQALALLDAEGARRFLKRELG